MARKRVSVTKESLDGRNESFKDNYTGKAMTRSEFVQEIKRGNPNYSKYHIREINGTETPVSNPDRSTHNNLS